MALKKVVVEIEYQDENEYGYLAIRRVVVDGNEVPPPYWLEGPWPVVHGASGSIDLQLTLD